MRLLISARNRDVAVEGGAIVEPGGDYDLVLTFPNADVAPGLINAHDHLHRNHYGRLGHPPYSSAYEWAADIQSREADRIAEGRGRARAEALHAGAWKNLFCGVTTVVHHDPWEPEFDAAFPLKVARVQAADSLGMCSNLSALHDTGRFCLHLAEGVDSRAAGEVDALAELGLLRSDLIAVHGVGMDEAAVARFRASGAALAWCPSSNQFLFGRTAPRSLLAEGIDLMLGSDSLLTGAGDLLDEIRYARTLGEVEDHRLADAVGTIAARRFGLPEPSLEVGAPSDLIVLRNPILEACAQDVLLVLVDGTARVAHPALGPTLDRFVRGAEEKTVGPVTRWTAIARGSSLQ